MTAPEWVDSVLTGDVRKRLADLPDNSINMVMTSPPYWQLRDYQDPDQIGHEKTVYEYIDSLIDICTQIQRVLRPDGCLWWNIGDAYDTDGTGLGLGDKQKALVPQRFEIALQESGWIVRNDAIWKKTNPMPQSTMDKLTMTTEDLVFATLQPRDYWFNLDAIREPHKHARPSMPREQYAESVDAKQPGNVNHAEGADDAIYPHANGKNPGDVIETSTATFKHAHFAVFPEELCVKPIKSSCPPMVCAACETPYEPIVERDENPEGITGFAGKNMDQTRGDVEANKVCKEGHDSSVHHSAEFKGWRQQCSCSTDETKPGIVLDPFAGAGTTLLTAKKLGRRFVGIELNEEYADMARARVGIEPKDPSRVDLGVLRGEYDALSSSWDSWG